MINGDAIHGPAIVEVHTGNMTDGYTHLAARKKPEEVLQRIVTLLGDVPRIELFPRERPVYFKTTFPIFIYSQADIENHNKKTRGAK